MNNSQWVKKSIIELNRIRETPEKRFGMYRMDRNERTWAIPESILASIRKEMVSETLTNYPELEDIYKKLADYLNISVEQLYFHTGSDLVIKSLFETYIEIGDKVLVQDPGYAMYKVYASMYQANLVVQKYEDDLSFDVHKYCTTIKKEKPKMVVFENPGGFIGNAYSHYEVESVIKCAKENNCLAIIDEAYIDFAKDESVIDLLDLYDNLIIVRTFSKAWGMAGVRVGYAIANELLICELFKVMPMHELTSVSSLILSVMIDHAEEILAYIPELEETRNYFFDQMNNLDIEYCKSRSNFTVIRIGDKCNIDDFRNVAKQHRFYVRRAFDQTFLKEWIRINFLPMEEMVLFVRFLRGYLNENQYI